MSRRSRLTRSFLAGGADPSRPLSRVLRQTLGAVTLTITAATFVLAPTPLLAADHSLEITVVGGGKVSVGGISCSSQCTIVASGEVTLVASSQPGPYLVNWSGDCLGLLQGDTCTLVMDGDKKLTAWFGGGQGVAVEMRGTGAGRIRSTPPGIDCSSGTCAFSFPPSVPEVSLSVEPAPGTTFGGWSGACLGIGACVLSMDGLRTHAVAALLYTRTPSLRVTRLSTGPITGSVTSDPPGISCGLPDATVEDCTQDYPQGGRVTLTAVPRVGLPSGARALSVLWDPACEANVSNQCVLTVDRPMIVEVRFFPLNGVDPPLNVTVVGPGRVTSEPAGIDCTSSCSHRFKGEVVRLRPIPEPLYAFTGWTGDCSGTGECILTVDSDKNVTATFHHVVRATVTTNRGRGTGRVTSNPGGIDCPGACEETWPPGTRVVLTATPDSGTSSFFSSWDLGPFSICSGGASTCTLSGNSWFTVDAIFDVHPMPLSVFREGTGSGRVWSAPPGIDCGDDCGEAVPAGLSVDLFAEPLPGSAFSGWGGDCSGSGPCRVVMNTTRQVTASFTRLHSLTVVKTGTGTGLVTSAPPGIFCGSSCSESYSSGASVALTVRPDNGSAFAGWGGACGGLGSCTVTLNSSSVVTASFVLGTTHTLSVARAGTGAGTVLSVPAGISCGADCDQGYPSGTLVTLSAQAEAGSQFAGWGGACRGLGACPVTMSSPLSVTATFTRQGNYFLQVSATGSGTVTSSDGRISYPSDCCEDYAVGTSVTLSAFPSAGYYFSGWSGACGGAGGCTVTMSEARSVWANFVAFPPPAHTLSVGVSNGGFVTSSPSGIFCPGDCSESYADGTGVSLSAVPSSGWFFSGWSGACGGNGGCFVSMTGPQSVQAVFIRQSFLLTVSKAGAAAAPGLVTGSGINCGADCSQFYESGTTLTLLAPQQIGVAFAGWGGDCTGAGQASTCTITMNGPKNVTAVFTFGPN